MSEIELRRVSVTLGGRRIVHEIDLEIAEGEWVALIGPNGAGKTTLLRAVSGLLPYDGTIFLGGRDTAAMHRREQSRLVALVPQEPSTPAWMTVGEYVLLGRTPHLGALARESLRDRLAASRALERLGLAPYADRLLGTLSGGEKQRAVVARALAQEASIVILDEPTAALDIGHQQQALELLEDLRRETSLTLVAAMHDLTLAAQYADRMVMIRDGRVVADGLPAEVLTASRIEEHYDATIRVIDLGGTVAVVPSRAARS